MGKAKTWGAETSWRRENRKKPLEAKPLKIRARYLGHVCVVGREELYLENANCHHLLWIPVSTSDCDPGPLRSLLLQPV